jgi:hypothetical protein
LRGFCVYEQLSIGDYIIDDGLDFILYHRLERYSYAVDDWLYFIFNGKGLEGYVVVDGQFRHLDIVGDLD